MGEFIEPKKILHHGAKESLVHFLETQTENIPEKEKEYALVMAEQLDTNYEARFQELRKNQADEIITKQEFEFFKRRLDEARAFFVDVKDKKWKPCPLVCMAKRFNNLETNEQQKPNLKALMQNIIALALTQQEQDPPTYATHNWEHTMLMDEIADNVLQEHPDILQVLQEQYEITEKAARFMVTMAIYFHDTGYPHVFSYKHGTEVSLSKVTHCIFSADLFFQEKIQKNLQALISSQNGKAKKLLNKCGKAIMAHSTDVGEETFNLRVVTNRGNFLTNEKKLPELLRVFKAPTTNPANIIRQITKIELAKNLSDEQKQRIAATIKTLTADQAVAVADADQDTFIGRYADLEHPTDKFVGLGKKAFDTNTEPLAVMVRLCDNLQNNRDRLREYEKSKLFFEILSEFGAPKSENRQRLLYLEDLAKQWPRGKSADKEVVLKIQNDMKQAILPVIPTESHAAFQARQYRRPEKLIRLFKDIIVQRVIVKYPEISEREKQAALDYGPWQIEPNWNYRNGHYSIEKIEMQGYRVIIHLHGDQNNGTVPKRIKVPEKLRDEQGKESTTKVPVEHYMAWKIIEALKSTTIDGCQLEPILIVDGQVLMPQYSRPKN